MIFTIKEFSTNYQQNDIIYAAFVRGMSGMGPM